MMTLTVDLSTDKYECTRPIYQELVERCYIGASRRFVFAHQVAALCTKWRRGRLESVMSNQKSDSINQSICIYLKSVPAKFHPDLIWNKNMFIAAVCTVVEILSLKYIRVASLTLRVTWRHRSRDWPHDSLYLISYWCFIGTDTNLKSVALTILTLLTLNTQKFIGVTWPWPWPLPISKKIFQGSCWDYPWDHLCQVLIFSNFEAISI